MRRQGYVLLWTGADWALSPSQAGARSVAAVAVNNVWAVGDEGILHWDGHAWSKVTAPSIGPLRGVAARGACFWCRCAGPSA